VNATAAMECLPVLVVIPARYASSRFPGKPLADIGGKPMIQRVYERVQASRFNDNILVATDDTRIMEAVEGFGGNAVMTPSSCSTGTDRIATVARERVADIYLNVQGDEPLISPRCIEAAVDPLFSNTNIDIGTVAAPLATSEEAHNPNIVKVTRALDGTALYFSRSPIPFAHDEENIDGTSIQYFQHLGIYAYRREALLRLSSLPPTPLEIAEKLEQLRALEHGMTINVNLVPERSISVDVPADIERVLAALDAESSLH